MEITNYCKKLMQFTRILNGFFRKCKKSLKAKNLQIENYIIFKDEFLIDNDSEPAAITKFYLKQTRKIGRQLGFLPPKPKF